MTQTFRHNVRKAAARMSRGHDTRPSWVYSEQQDREGLGPPLKYWLYDLGQFS